MQYRIGISIKLSVTCPLNDWRVILAAIVVFYCSRELIFSKNGQLSDEACILIYRERQVLTDQAEEFS